MDEATKLSFAYGRRFGVEIELNAFDNRDFRKNPLRKGELPEGIHYIANAIAKLLDTQVDITKWGHTHNNNNWVLKPDSSCGIEVCSPVSKGWLGLKQICQVVDLFRRDEQIKADQKCSLHVHMDMADMCQVSPTVKWEDFLGIVVAYWVKCESVFLDSVPAQRKNNRYCQCIGACDLFDHDIQYSPRDIVKLLGMQKYYSINTLHLCEGKRPTMEFRIVESDGCKDPYLVKNWIRLLVHFIEVAKRHPFPPEYKEGDRWSSLLWLDPEDVMSFLGFIGGYELSHGMEQTRNWFLARLKHNLSDNKIKGLWSDSARQVAREQIERMIATLRLTDTIDEWLHPSDREVKLYDRTYQN